MAKTRWTRNQKILVGTLIVLVIPAFVAVVQLFKPDNEGPITVQGTGRLQARIR